MYNELIQTVLNTKRWTGSIEHLLIHPEALREFKAEAKRIVPGYEIRETDYEILCSIPIKTSSECEIDKIYFGIKY